MARNAGDFSAVSAINACSGALVPRTWLSAARFRSVTI